MKILLIVAALAILFSFNCGINEGEVVRKVHQSASETTITSYHFIAGRHIKKVQKNHQQEGWFLILRNQSIALKKIKCSVSKEVFNKVRIGETFNCGKGK